MPSAAAAGRPLHRQDNKEGVAGPAGLAACAVGVICRSSRWWRTHVSDQQQLQLSAEQRAQLSADQQLQQQRSGVQQQVLPAQLLFSALQVLPEVLLLLDPGETHLFGSLDSMVEVLEHLKGSGTGGWFERLMLSESAAYRSWHLTCMEHAQGHPV